jgi:hypothetical protein
MIAIVAIFYTIVFLYDFLPLYQEKKKKKEIGVYAVLALLSLGVAVLLSFGVRIPSPEKPIREFITSIFGK